MSGREVGLKVSPNGVRLMFWGKQGRLLWINSYVNLGRLMISYSPNVDQEWMDEKEEEVLQKYPWGRNLVPFETDLVPNVCRVLEWVKKARI